MAGQLSKQGVSIALPVANLVGREWLVQTCASVHHMLTKWAEDCDVPQELFDIRGAACKITWLACSFSDVTTFTRLCDKLKGRSASNNNVEVEWLASHA